MKAIGIIGFLQESNTFLSEQTTLKHFRDDVLVVGNEVIARFENSHHEIGGFLSELGNQQLTVVPLLVTGDWTNCLA